jgi:uncharacterized membrane protein YdjX (TVP38/TMEM64 family)
MSFSSRQTGIVCFILVVFVLTLWGLGTYLGMEIDTVMDQIKQNRVWGAGLYILFLALSIVIAPFTSLPLLPFAAEIWGVWFGTLLSILGWWLGAIGAFLLARWLGRPLLARFIPLHTLDRWEKRIPPDITFWGIVLLRLILPVEIPSFALAFIKSLSFRTYALATLVGITPFAFLWVMFGKALFNQAWGWSIILGLSLLLVTYLAYRIRTYYRH